MVSGMEIDMIMYCDRCYRDKPKRGAVTFAGLYDSENVCRDCLRPFERAPMECKRLVCPLPKPHNVSTSTFCATTNECMTMQREFLDELILAEGLTTNGLS